MEIRHPAISVCIANYNGMEVIDACLESVLSQDVDAIVEIIVHDDASTDGSVSHIRDFYPNLKLIESVENVGFCVANNRMVIQAEGDFILLLNNDAELMPGALSALLAASTEYNKPGILSLPQYSAQSGKIIDRGCMLDPFFSPVPNLSSCEREVAMVIGACLWLPRLLWVRLGGFPEWFGSIGEDLYLCSRARLSGHYVRVLPVSGYLHRCGHSFGGGKLTFDYRMSTTFLRRSLSERNKTFTMIVCCPRFISIRLFLHLIVLNIEGMLLSIVKLNFQIWKKIYMPIVGEVWRHRALLKRSRLVIQRDRKISHQEWFSRFVRVPWKLSMFLKYGLPDIKDNE